MLIAALIILQITHFTLPQSLPRSDTQIALSQPLVVRWRYLSDLTLNLTPAVRNDRVYLPLSPGTLVSLRASDGQLYWISELGGEVSASPVADEQAVYIATETTGRPGPEPRATGAIRALGKDSGVTLWMRTLRRPFQGSLALSGNVLFGGTTDGRVIALDRSTGRFVWATQHWAAFASQPLITDDRVYIGAEDGTLLSLDRLSGRIIWRYRTRGAVRGKPAIIDGAVYFGSADGYVYAVDKITGQRRWRVRTGAGVQSVASASEGLLAASLDNFVYYLTPARGDRLWKRQLAGRIASQPLMGGDGALFIPLSGDAGIVLDLNDGKPVNTLPLGDDNSTGAAPVAAADVLLLTTRRGLLAFGRPDPE